MPGELPAAARGCCKVVGGETAISRGLAAGPCGQTVLGEGGRQALEATLSAFCADRSGPAAGARSYAARLHSAHEARLSSRNVHVPASAGVC